MANIKLLEITSDNKNELVEYISLRRDTSFVDYWEWRRCLEIIYGFKHFWYIAKYNGNTVGFLGLVMADHPIFGKYMVTAPFASQGGFYADTKDAFGALIHKAGDLQDEYNAHYALIRHINNNWEYPANWHTDLSYATFNLELDINIEQYLKKNIRGSLKNTINGFKNKDLNIFFGRNELIDDFWKVISMSMKELGSPYHSKRYVETLMNCMDPKAEIVISKTGQGEITGGGLILSHQGKIEVLHMNAINKYKSIRIADYLYWSTIKEAISRNIKLIDMGRSLVESGNEKYKMKWKPIRNILCYSYRLTPNMKVPNINQRNPRLKFAINVWKRMPLVVANFLGPRLISGIL